MVLSELTHYFSSIEGELQKGNATEHTHRPALKHLIESLAENITATNEPKRIACGAPDFIVTRGLVPVGYIEAKDVGKNLDEAEKSEQMTRYRESLGNVILTDYLEFRWYVAGKHRLTVRPARLDRTGKIQFDPEKGGHWGELLNAFLMETSPTVHTPNELAARMAALARLIREAIKRAFQDEDKGGALHGQLESFREVLIHDLSEEQFADMYAQTIGYGLFAARCNIKESVRFTREHAAFDLPKTNPFLRKMFTHIAGPDLDERITWAVDDLAELLHRADIFSILEDFGKRTRREDPVVHFYESFLAAYDPQMREARGVYYTPEPVVSYIVRSVDSILKEDFGCPDGLADTSKIPIYRTMKTKNGKLRREKTGECHKVLILDPAVGTGTFLHGVVDHIYEHQVEKGQAGAWSGYVSSHLLPRLFGFELLMAPYTVAHMKLGLQLAESGYDFKSGERLRVYLTNSLEEAHESTHLPLFAQWLVEEANAAGEIKQEAPVMVILGNPPYSGHSENVGEWIKNLLRGKDTLTGESTANYFAVDGQPLGERNPKWLNDDYVKFIRFAQWRIEQTGYGILAFISNHGYLDNPTFRGMRQSLMDAFDDIYILDLHGNSKKKERCPDGSKDENVFDIQQGVAIGIFVKRPFERKKKTIIRHADLWGIREIYKKENEEESILPGCKYHWLWNHHITNTKWKRVKPSKPFYFLIPKDNELQKEYDRGWKISEFMPVNSCGIVTARDSLTIKWTKNEVEKTIRDFASLSPEKAREKYQLGEDVRDWKVSLAQEDVKKNGLNQSKIVPILYRPFDRRYTYYTGQTRGFHCMPRPEVMKHMLAGNNIAVSTTRSIEISRGWEHIFCTKDIIQHHAVSLKEVNYLFPLYLYPPEKTDKLFEIRDPEDVKNGRSSNLSDAFIEYVSQKINRTFVRDGKGDLHTTFGPEDLFDYMYALFHSPAYRQRYAEFLKIDFPRLPIPSNINLFRSLCGIGAKLIPLHLLDKYNLQGNPSDVETTGFPSLITAYPISGDDRIETIQYTEPLHANEKGRIWINASQFFKGISPHIWNFHIGGYQVCQKWLKDRKGRQLTFEELTHYQRMIASIHETIGLMETIDTVIERYGGFPIQ
ncbi:MAG: DNA methyltransferase [Candidatus Omnitrophota bacterium]|jgi:predicted helicase|nr:MAG: DNA methyltransferase [Candidatus Omnitrophota bacterium]